MSLMSSNPSIFVHRRVQLKDSGYARLCVALCILDGLNILTNDYRILPFYLLSKSFAQRGVRYYLKFPSPLSNLLAFLESILSSCPPPNTANQHLIGKHRALGKPIH